MVSPFALKLKLFAPTLSKKGEVQFPVTKTVGLADGDIEGDALGLEVGAGVAHESPSGSLFSTRIASVECV